MANTLRPLTRTELTEFLPNQRAVRAFEQLFDIVPGDLLTLIDDIQAAQGTATLATSQATRNLGQMQRADPARKGLVFVASIGDLPNPVSDVISLVDGYTYFFTKQVELYGNRLALGTNTALLGASRHTCGIGSTGLFDPIVTASTSVYIADMFVNGDISVPASTIGEIRVSRCELVGIDVSTSVVMDPESYILEDCKFTGGGAYLAGILSDDNRASFSRCVGIPNSTSATGYYAVASATSTPIASVGVPVKALLATTAMGVLQRFTLSDNRATYVGTYVRPFKISAAINLNATANDDVAVYIAINGTVLAETETPNTCDGFGTCLGIKLQGLVELEETDYIEVWVENNSSAANITVVDLNLIVEAV